jgi:hypothetical protein
MRGIFPRRARWLCKIVGALVTCLAMVFAVASQHALAAEQAPSGAGSHQAPQDDHPWLNCQNRPTFPGLGQLYPGQPIYVTITSQAAGWTSDLMLGDASGHEDPLQPDAKDHVGKTFSLEQAMSRAAGSSFFTLDIYVHENGNTYKSTSANAFAVAGDGDNDRYICFEDGFNTTYDDLVVHVGAERPSACHRPGGFEDTGCRIVEFCGGKIPGKLTQEGLLTLESTHDEDAAVG